MVNNSDTVSLHRNLTAKTTPTLSYWKGDLKAWQADLKAKLHSLLGLDNMPPATEPLNVRTLWEREVPRGTAQKILFTSEPGYDVPAYVCTPHDRTLAGPEGKLPWYVCLQGHSTGMHNSLGVARDYEGQPIEVKEDRDFALGCLARGIGALCIEQRAFGECEDPTQENYGRCHNPAMGALMLGRTLLGERVYDVDRGLDYLFTRDDVDRSRLGVMGNSGGGTVSLFSGALLDRITHVLPSCCFSTFKDSIMALNHCVCNYVPGLLTTAEMSDVAGLIAPRPLVIVNGERDDIFPIEAARVSFEKLRLVYEEAGKPDNCRHVVGPEGHRFYADIAWEEMLKYLS